MGSRVDGHQRLPREQPAASLDQGVRAPLPGLPGPERGLISFFAAKGSPPDHVAPPESAVSPTSCRSATLRVATNSSLVRWTPWSRGAHPISGSVDGSHGWIQESRISTGSYPRQRIRSTALTTSRKKREAAKHDGQELADQRRTLLRRAPGGSRRDCPGRQENGATGSRESGPPEGRHKANLAVPAPRLGVQGPARAGRTWVSAVLSEVRAEAFNFGAPHED